MDQHRAMIGITDILEDVDEADDVMSVDRADIIESQFLE